jgi:dephospho-CoA kinase
VGLAGGIASGKSTVAKILSNEPDVSIIDADKVAWETYSVGTEVYDQLVERFGKEILADDSSIDRRSLSRFVFKNEEDRLFLNSIVHPAVRKRYKELAAEAQANGVQIFIIEAALILDREEIDKDFFDLYVLITVAEEEQLERLLARGSLSEVEARTRIISQTPQDVKASRADYVIDTTCSIGETENRIAELLSWMRERNFVN